MNARVPGLGEIRAVTGVTGETFVAVDWRKQMLAMNPAGARELAAALLAVAGEAEAADAAAAAEPSQDTLWEVA